MRELKLKQFCRRYFSILSMFVLLTMNSFGAYLRNVPQLLMQPDGTIIRCFASGDEFYSWLHDSAGFTITRNQQTKFYEFANLQNNILIPSGFIVGKHNPQKAMIAPGINPSADEIIKIRNRALMVDSSLPQNRILAPKTGTINNIVIFVRFSGENEFNDPISTYSALMNDSYSGANSMYNYFREVSYNTLTVTSSFYPATSGTYVVSYQDSYSREYFMPISMDPQGYDGETERRDREHSLLKRAVEFVASQIASSLAIDNDGDGNVDNVCFIASGSPTGWSHILWPHKWELYSQNVYINGKKVSTYNFNLQNSIKTNSGVGVLCHEMFHSIGAPDLYHYSLDYQYPVGSWDIMEQSSNPPQHMGAYMKYRYGTWIPTIQIINTPGSYLLNPLTESSNNCYKILSPNSTSEYFIVEYRKKTGTFENSLPGQGLLVYRINSTEDGNGNANGPPDEVYIYRPNGTLTSVGNISLAAFSSDVGRTDINDGTNPSSFLSDGSAGGLQISSISSCGNTISFTLGSPQTKFIDIALVLDKSSSMSSGSGSYMELAKAAARTFVGHTQINDNIAVVSFNTSATVNFPLTAITSNIVKANAQNAIDAIYSSGRTSIGAGMRYAQYELDKGHTQIHQAMILLSDGKENEAPWVMDELPNIPFNTDIYTIALGLQSDEPLLQHIATSTDGTYHFAPDPQTLQELYLFIRARVTGEQAIARFANTISQGQTNQHNAYIDSYTTFVTFSLTFSQGDIDLELVDPSGMVIDAAKAASDPTITYSEGATYDFYTVDAPRSGQWLLKVIGTNVPAPQDYIVTLFGASNLRMDTYFGKNSYMTNEPILVKAKILANSTPVTGASVIAEVQQPGSSYASRMIDQKENCRIENHDGASTSDAISIMSGSLVLYDDGTHGDDAANDGVYANYYRNTSKDGSYNFTITATGIAPGGGQFSRIGKISIFVEPATGPTTITLTSPNGGETWYVGNSYQITWTSDNYVGQVMIEISTTNGTSWWDVTQGQFASNSGSYNYTPVPENVSDNCYFRVTSIENPAASDQSNATFRILIGSGGIKHYVAAQLPQNVSPPIVDGQLNDVAWTYATGDALLDRGGTPDAWLSSWTNFSDNQVKWRLVWSAQTNLIYGAVEIQDDVAGASDNIPENLWHDDTINLYVDGDKSGGVLWNNLGNAQHWFIRRDNLKNLNYTAGPYTGSVITSSIQYGANGNWKLEFAMKIYDTYPSIQKILTAGNVIGWDVWYDDSDNATWSDNTWRRDHQVGWGYSGPCFSNAIYFHELELGAAPSVPVLSINPTTLDFGKSETILTLQISNAGSGTLIWQITESPEKSWITSINPSSGANPGTVAITVNRNFLSSQNDNGTLSITSNGGNQSVSVYIAKEEGNLPAHWDYTSTTGNSATAILLTSANPNINGAPLQTGDYIGVFTPSGLCCGHAQWQINQNLSITIWGDDDQTTEIDGFKPGELILYRVYRTSEQKEWSNVEVGYQEGSGFYSVNAILTINKFNVSDATTMMLNLVQGWNMFSINVMPSELSIANLMSPIVNQVKIVKDNIGRSYIPTYGINTIGNINVFEGYQAYMNSTTTLTVVGDQMNPNSPIYLAQGWCMVSYLPQSPIDAASALSTIQSQLKIAKDNVGKTYIPQYGINTIGDMLPGQGYLLYLTSPATLVYPSNNQAARAPWRSLPKEHSEQQVASHHFDVTTKTGSNAVIVIPAEIEPRYDNDRRLDIGDEIGIFNSDGRCCGAAVWQGQNVAITVWGDDEQTDEVDGLQTGKPYEMKVWCKAENNAYPVRLVLNNQSEHLFQPDGYWISGSMIISTQPTQAVNSQGISVPAAYRLLQNYPNPFNSETSIEFHLPAPSQISLKIYDLQGHVIYSLAEGKIDAGFEKVRWNGCDMNGKTVPSGIYFARIDINASESERHGFSDVIKLIMMK
ncbi:M6 family metalloprotease domain-containing protein [candidate division KSB1 bacterium]|nr:M6 family metalloprotease domain-containing protein [candidate division KSB1 bacterium]